MPQTPEQKPDEGDVYDAIVLYEKIEKGRRELEAATFVGEIMIARENLDKLLDEALEEGLTELIGQIALGEKGQQTT